MQPFPEMLDFLKRNGYSVELSELSQSDEAAESAIMKHASFCNIQNSKHENVAFSLPTQTPEERLATHRRVDEEKAKMIKEYYGI